MSETVTMTIADFLLARYAEDEAAARHAAGWGGSWVPFPDWGHGAVESVDSGDDIGIVIYDEGRPTPAQAEHIARHDPARALADIEAKRRIVERFRYISEGGGVIREGSPLEGQLHALAWVVTDLASAFADHPDYRAEEWAP